jgi:hypothetical protein
MKQYVTDVGAAAIASATASGQALEFLGMAIGDGVFSESTMDPTAMTRLIDEVARIDISEVRRSGNTITVVTDVTNGDLATGTKIRELGIIARVGGTSILLAYGYDLDPETVPDPSDSDYERRFVSTITLADDEIGIVVTRGSSGVKFDVVDGRLKMTVTITEED